MVRQMGGKRNGRFGVGKCVSGRSVTQDQTAAMRLNSGRSLLPFSTSKLAFRSGAKRPDAPDCCKRFYQSPRSSIGSDSEGR